MLIDGNDIEVRLRPNGFANKDLRTLTDELRGLDPDTVSTGQMTYDLRG
ncbi:hypothetical protein [Rhodococcus opacus]|nr:hypothetical protein [Rhodococcus opacus]UZG59934.1 hypothetical protein ONE62_40125 [Rhodococcus opacus]